MFGLNNVDLRGILAFSLLLCCMTSPSYSAEARVWSQQLKQDFFGCLADLGGETRRFIDEPSLSTDLSPIIVPALA